MTNADRFIILIFFLFALFFNSATGELRRVKIEILIRNNHAEVIKEIKQLDKIKRDFMSSIELAKKNRG